MAGLLLAELVFTSGLNACGHEHLLFRRETLYCRNGLKLVPVASRRAVSFAGWVLWKRLHPSAEPFDMREVVQRDLSHWS